MTKELCNEYLYKDYQTQDYMIRRIYADKDEFINLSERIRELSTELQKQRELMLQQQEIARSYWERLQEIKEVINQQNADIKVPWNRNTEIRMKFILQKISEAEE